MSKAVISNPALNKLVNEFATASREHYKSLKRGNGRMTRKHEQAIETCFGELIEFEEEGRRALLTLTDSKEPEVALMAATYSLGYDPDNALAVLEAIAVYQVGLLSFRAGHVLEQWREGSWKPG